MKFFRRVSKRAGNLYSVGELGVVGNDDPASICVNELFTRVRSDLAVRLGCSPEDVPLDEPADALEYDPTAGLVVTLHRSAAAEVEPWLLLPLFVSGDEATIAEVYVAKEYAITGESGCGTNEKKSISSNGGIPNALVLPLNGQNDVTRMASAWSITGNPYLFIPSQPMALLCCTLVRPFTNYIGSTSALWVWLEVAVKFRVVP